MLTTIRKLFPSDSAPYAAKPEMQIRIELGLASLNLAVPKHAINETKKQSQKMAYAHSTFGKGNQHWYENDEHLIKNIG